jgi:4a-hydroxytetrahydrobiopterin dehydratase
MTTLIGERCVACRPDAPRVTEAEITQFMPLIPEWKRAEHDGEPRLERTFRFKDFRQALAFAQQVGELAEEEGHHPAILVEWGRVNVSWWTHKIKGLHRNDFIMAAKTDQIATSGQG